jgi:hypothetical protein
MKRLMILIAVCCFSLASQAGLTNWNPGVAGTTQQVWQFNTGDKTVLPEIYDNPYYNPNENVLAAKISNALHPDAFTWADGVWSGSKFSMTMDIPNNPVANPWKEVLVEVVYKGTIVDEWVMDSDWNEFEKLLSYDIQLCDGWMKRIDLWYIEPNPNSERLCYGFNPSVTGAPAAVDSISVSTICIPEPVTMLLLSLGAITLRKRK